MTIFVDMDDVLEDLLGAWVSYLNKKYGTSVNVNDIKEWDMKKYFPKLPREDVFEPLLRREFWDTTQPKDGAQIYLKKIIDDGHEVYIATATHYATIQDKMERVLFKYFPYLTWKNIIIISNKQLLRGDVLIDDAVHNLIGGSYRKLLFTAPHNLSYNAEDNGMTRVGNWEDVYRVICDLSRKETEHDHL